jgi:hypothetical protein
MNYNSNKGYKIRFNNLNKESEKDKNNIDGFNIKSIEVIITKDKKELYNFYLDDFDYGIYYNLDFIENLFCEVAQKILSNESDIYDLDDNLVSYDEIVDKQYYDIIYSNAWKAHNLIIVDELINRIL